MWIARMLVAGINGLMRLMAKTISNTGTTIEMAWLSVLSSATECWQRMQLSSDALNTPWPWPASSIDVNSRTAAVAMSHRRSRVGDWRIDENMGRNLIKFSSRRKCYVVTFVKKLDSVNGWVKVAFSDSAYKYEFGSALTKYSALLSAYGRQYHSQAYRMDKHLESGWYSQSRALFLFYRRQL